MFDIEPIFCTYFKKIERFRYKHETYNEYVAFCVRRGSFFCQIENEKKERVSEGEIVICPPNHRFYREIITPVELCMIKFNIFDTSLSTGKPIKVSNLLRWNEDLEYLEGCLLCDKLNENPRYYHYCMDILYIAIATGSEHSRVASAKTYIDQNYDKNLYIGDIAKHIGYTVPYLTTKFKLCYGVTPKTYLLQIRLQKAKDLLLTTDMLSREIAYALGFTDELYFIRFFKKYIGVTPRQFKERGL